MWRQACLPVARDVLPTVRYGQKLQSRDEPDQNYGYQIKRTPDPTILQLHENHREAESSTLAAPDRADCAWALPT